MRALATVGSQAFHPIVLDLYKADLHKGIANCKLLPIMLELIQDDLYIPSNQICIYIIIIIITMTSIRREDGSVFNPIQMDANLRIKITN